MNNNFVKYRDLLTVNSFDEETDKEEFVLLPLKDEYVIGEYKQIRNMREYGDQIPVRKTVYEMLKKAAEKLKQINPNYMLVVAYGYRDMKKQVEYFNQIVEKVKNKFTNKIDMYEYVHEKIAVPEVAGHPTGGAVDVEIFDIKANKALDFGTEILDYSTTKCYYYSNKINKEVIENRKLLRRIMLEEGFAPYDGEWWHFSYGDKEWAFYYKKEKALYNQVEAERIFKN